MGEEKQKSGKIWVRVSLAILAVAVLSGLAYLQAASMLSFRLWRGDANLQGKNYQDAILWYSRALRSAGEEQSPQRIAEITSRLYRAYEGFCRWEFDGDRLWGWFAGNQIGSLTLHRGTLEVRSTGESPWLEIIHLRLAPNRTYRFQVRMQTKAGTQAELRWAPLTDVFDAEHVVAVALIADGQWHDYAMEMTPLKSEIGKLRFCPMNASGLVTIDQIQILPASKL